MKRLILVAAAIAQVGVSGVLVAARSFTQKAVTHMSLHSRRRVMPTGRSRVICIAVAAIRCGPGDGVRSVLVRSGTFVAQ